MNRKIFRSGVILAILAVYCRGVASFQHCSKKWPLASRYVSGFNPPVPASSRNAASRGDGGDTDDEDPINESFNSKDLTPLNSQVQEEDLLGYAIDSFLRGDYNLQFADDAPAPHPGLSPGSSIETCLRSLRQLDSPGPSHGAAVLMRFCVPLSRGERWGDSTRAGRDPWKEILRGALTPSMLARRIRASEFSGLLDWTSLDVTEGAYSLEKDLVGLPSIAFVNVALFFGDGIEPSLIQFTLRRVGGVWLIDTARHSQKGLFMKKKEDEASQK
jgi:hypothetical protein